MITDPYQPHRRGPKQLPSNGSATTHAKQRRRLRRRLEERGVPADVIERKVAALAVTQREAREAASVPAPTPVAPDGLREQQLTAAADRAQVPVDDFDAHVDAWHRANRVDDRGYRPVAVDPLARGTARVSPATLAASRRNRATTRYEYDRQETA